MKCIIYARKSTESEDRQVQSLEDQLRIMRETAERRGLVIVDEISESRSAKIPNNRPGFNRLIELIEKGSVSAVLVWHVDRLSRNPLDGGRLAQLLIDGKLELIQTPDRQYLSEDSPIFLAIETAVAAGYSQTLSKNVKRGMQSKAAKGWLPGKPPLGYRNNPWNREIEPHPDQFPWIKHAWELAVSTNKPVREISAELEVRWPSPTPISAERRYRKLYEIFRNPFYAGFFRYDGKILPGKHVRLVTPTEFEHVRAKYSLVKDAPRPSKHAPLFLGMIRCAGCGGPATVTRSKKVCKNGTVHHYVYYHCTGHRGCAKQVVDERRIMEALSSFAKSIAVHPSVFEFVSNQIRHFAPSLIETRTMTQTHVQDELAKIGDRLTRLTAMRLEGEIDSEEYKSMKASLLAGRKLLEDRSAHSSQLLEQTRVRLAQIVAPGEPAFRVCQVDSESNLRELASRLKNSIYIHHRQLEFRLDTVLEKIASIKPPVSSSQCLDSNDFCGLTPDWCTEMRNVLEPLCEEVLAELSENA